MDELVLPPFFTPLRSAKIEKSQKSHFPGCRPSAHPSHPPPFTSSPSYPHRISKINPFILFSDGKISPVCNHPLVAPPPSTSYPSYYRRISKIKYHFLVSSGVQKEMNPLKDTMCTGVDYSGCLHLLALSLPPRELSICVYV